ncbi:pullulanase-type alpha-1,6-glucosidase [Granulicella tundricola]|uniref:pullulanase n=1 Tax=Granulicella tundricola (strain ATCC BAA-1859 / DSM 23138 / MP5ACTX9) TaxID=1198114 RepID=E8X6X0_GRATM|nr:pullulanase-type alpha-1,6-glucosidase [Granulicella tundricola]ADW71079.1 alpha-1,6-glucosidase, pullulanase-type [Granulicella tundricola MP5ACTX9]
MQRKFCLGVFRLFVFLLCGLGVVLQAQTPIPANHIRIHYHRADAVYTGWTVYGFGQTTEDTSNFESGPVQVTGTDSFGAFFDVGVVAGASGAQSVGIIVHMGDTKDTPQNEYADPSQGSNFYQLSGATSLTTTQPPIPVNHKNPNIPANTARIHFYRPDGIYTNWTVYAFNDTTEDESNYNSGPIFPTGTDAYGAYYDVPLIPNPNDLGFIVHNIATGTKNTPADLHLDVADYNEAWIISGDPTVYLTQPTAAQLLNANFLKLQAFWIDKKTILIQNAYAAPGGSYYLSSDKSAALALGANGVTGGTKVTLKASGSLTAQQIARFPQLATGYTVLTLPANISAAAYLNLVQGQLAVTVLKSDGTSSYATGVQNAGVLDDLYAYTGQLGVIVRHSGFDDCWSDFADDEDGRVKVKVWAPTAQTMKLQLFKASTDTAPAQVVTMHEHDGVWVAKLDESWIGKYYLLDEMVYAPSTRQVVENIVSDPYSIDIALNGTKSRLTDVDADSNKPYGWDFDRSPYLDRLNDLTIYELHLRDFSIGDKTVPTAHRGMYLAFTDRNSDGMEHLRTLAQSGLKAVHLLPTFHFNSVNEDKSTWATTPDLTSFAPDSQSQQAAVTAIQSADAYNWGYDPDHYLAPEGSYAVNPDQRVREYREMVMSLHHAGLRVIQDVVFNHTSGFGEATNSILDEVVPDYYNRLDADGNLETGSCCADTATEHLMMGKLQQDAILWNAKKYKIDGFRFDIMSFTFVKNLEEIKKALAKLTPERDGIDGSKIYIYGEGFSFGETANSALGVNAQQSNLFGTGIGSFNDRMRDGVRGGGPFDDERVQGFATGLLTDPSLYTTSIAGTSAADQQSTLLHRTDWIKVGLTGNLRDYTFVDATGKTITGAQLDYQGQPTGYTATPIEAVNYVSVHDNQDLFDTIQVKASLNDSSAIRAKRQVLAMSLVALGQGVPFFHAGDDLLRSRDMDQNAYDSGDWFNKIDWTGTGNNWGIGLPIASQNSSQWSFQQPLLANGAYKPQPADIQSTTRAFQTFLRIRESSPLFSMSNAAEIQQHLTFLNAGPSQVPGLIVMNLQANARNYGPYGQIVVVFNASDQEQSFTAAQLKGLTLKLDPLQAEADPTLKETARFDRQKGTLTVPSLTTVVFVNQ